MFGLALLKIAWRSGARWGMALAAWEVGLAAPVRFAELEGAFHSALLVLAPFGSYVLLGAAAGWLSGLLTLAAGRRLALHELLPAAAAIGLGWTDAARSGASFAAAWWPAALGALSALSLAAMPWYAPRSWRREIGRSALIWGILGLGGVSLWLLLPRDPRRAELPAAAPAAGSPNVVLITWDTVRADVLPIYGGTGLETPVLESLAATGAVFEDMVAVAPITGPSHATLLSGRAPPSHGLRSMGTTAIAAATPLLAERFRAAGYDTAAFVAAIPLRRGFGFERGFRVYDDRFRHDRLTSLLKIGKREMALGRYLHRRLQHHSATQLAGERIVERAGEFVAAAERPFFLWAHFFDAHGPQDPPPELLARARELSAGATPAPADPVQCAATMTLYRAEIMELDALLGRLLARLEERDPGLDDTVLFLVADHGHCFGEGGHANTHTPSLMEATQRVPALLVAPRAQVEGLRVSSTVCQVDVPATLLDLAALEPLPGQQGVSLLPALRDGPPLERSFFRDGFYIEAYQKRLSEVKRGGGRHDQRKIGLRTPHWKLWYTLGKPEEPRLYRLAGGREELVADPPAALLERLQADFRRLLEQMPQAQATEFRMSESDAADLGALGYVDGNER